MIEIAAQICEYRMLSLETDYVQRIARLDKSSGDMEGKKTLKDILISLGYSQHNIDEEMDILLEFCNEDNSEGAF